MFRQQAQTLGKRKANYLASGETEDARIFGDTDNNNAANMPNSSTHKATVPSVQKYKTFCKTRASDSTSLRRSIQLVDEHSSETNTSKAEIFPQVSPTPRAIENPSRSITRSADNLSTASKFRHDDRYVPERRALLINSQSDADSRKTSNLHARSPRVQLIEDGSHADHNVRDSTRQLDVRKETPYEQMIRDRMQWHKDQQTAQRSQLEHDYCVVDQGTGVSVLQLLTLFLQGSVYPEQSPLLVRFWVTQLNATFSLGECVRQLMVAKIDLQYNVQQNVCIFADSPNIHVPLEILSHKAMLAVKALGGAFSVNNATYAWRNRENAVPRASFFSRQSVKSEGQHLCTYSGFRFNHVLEHMLTVTRVALVRDLSCEILRVGFRVLASSAALTTISCALQTAYCAIKQEMAPLEERALRGRTLDVYLTRQELERLFYLQQREQILMTLIYCANHGVLYELTKQYVLRGEIASRFAL